MGCASSSPLINGGGPGGVVESAKEAATKTANDVLHAGEAAIHDVGEHVKGAVQNVTHEIENVLGGGKKADKSDHINEDDEPAENGHGDGDDPTSKIIRLKGSRQSSVEDTELMENMKNDLMSKAQSVGDDTDRLADDLMKDTDELMRDAETGIAHHEMTTRITSAEDGTIEILNLEEPEIERILAAGADDPHTPGSPKATLHSLAVPTTGKDEGMPPAAEDKPDMHSGETVWPTPQTSLDGESVGSSGGEEHFRNEVLRATAIRTPARSGVRRSPGHTATRAPPPSTSRSERMQRFIFKLNSVILSDIEERVGARDEGSIVRQLERNPEKVVELLSKSSVDDDDEPDGDVMDGPPKRSCATKPSPPGALRRQHSVSLEADTGVDCSPDLVEELCQDGNGQEMAATGHSARTAQLKDVPPSVRLRALMRFQSLDGFGSESSSQRRKAHRRMTSLDSIDVDEQPQAPQETELEPSGVHASPDTLQDVPYDPDEEERICQELLAELRSLEEADRADANNDRNVVDGFDSSEHDQEACNETDQTSPAGSAPKTAWEKLQDYLQRVPKRRNSDYDLYYDSDEDSVLKTLFKHHKAKLLFHYSSSDSSSDTL